MSAESEHPDAFDHAYWEGHYRESGPGPETRAGANPYLVAWAGGLVPGRALDAGCGRGEEALWLAERGWSVQAVDIAAAPLAAARERAAALGGEVADRITWRQTDLSAHPPAAEAFDLVCSHYVHTETGPAALLEALAAAVAPGGMLLVAAHHPDDAHHADTPGAHLTPQQAAAVLDPQRWRTLTAETATRQVDTGGHGQGHGHGHRHPMVLTDTVLCARRRR